VDAIEAIHGRQGVLRFRPDPVPPDQIDAVLAAAAAAPSPVNLQPWAFVVVADPAMTCRVARYLVHAQEKRVFEEFLAMPAAYTERLMGLYEGFDRTPCFILVCLDPKVRFAQPQHETVLREWHLVCLGAAMENLMIAATALGLGTRWFGGFALDGGGATLKEMLGIPCEVELVAATPVGYYDEPPKSRPPQELAALAEFRRGDSRALGRLLRGKLPVESVVHRERW
jgi:nicotinate-nucleotide--dimethylbenzimidazole phosphoribosyltransferase